MSKATALLLAKWIVQVMYMIGSRPEIFSWAERKELAEITYNLDVALKRDAADREV